MKNSKEFSDKIKDITLGKYDILINRLQEKEENLITGILPNSGQSRKKPHGAER